MEIFYFNADFGPDWSLYRRGAMVFGQGRRYMRTVEAYLKRIGLYENAMT